MERRKPGPPSKGDRVLMGCRVPRRFKEALLTEATRRGMTLNDLVGETLAEIVDAPYYPNQEVL
ncbi:MAG: hypothetical protein ACRDQA_00925, partial [Nocardioidaceae bacterium]